VKTRGGVEGSDDTPEAPLAVALRLPAKPSSLPELRGAIRGFLTGVPLDAERRHAAQLAATEAASNVVRYAYPPGEPGPIELELDYEDGSVELILRDYGKGLRPGSSDSFGVGLGLIAALTDDFSITEGDRGGVEVWMRFVAAARGDAALTALIARFLDAVSRRSTKDALPLVHAEVELQPLLLDGLRRTYRGHVGVREWFADLTGSKTAAGAVLEPTEIRQCGPGRVLAACTFDFGLGAEPVCGMYEVDEDGLIQSVSEYFTTPDELARLERL